MSAVGCDRYLDIVFEPCHGTRTVSRPNSEIAPVMKIEGLEIKTSYQLSQKRTKLEV